MLGNGRAVYRRMAGEVVETVEDERVGGRTVARRKRETQGGILHWKREQGPDVEWFRARIRDAFGGRAPRVLDPFAGGGAIPLEAMRLGCAVTAVDLNPVAWFILKCTLDYPRRLAGETRPLPAFALRDRAFMAASLKARGVKGRALKRELAELCLGDDRETEPPSDRRRTGAGGRPRVAGPRMGTPGAGRDAAAARATVSDLRGVPGVEAGRAGRSSRGR